MDSPLETAPQTWSHGCASQERPDDAEKLLNVRGLLEFSSATTPSRVNSIPMTMNALAETLRGLHQRPHGSAGNLSGVLGCHSRSASLGSDRRRGDGGVGVGAAWARNVGWPAASESGDAALDVGSPSPATSTGKVSLAREGSPPWRSSSSPEERPPPVPERKNSALLRVGHLGGDPREAAKLMSKKSTFVEVDGVSLPPRHPPSQSVPASLLTAVGRKRGGRASSWSGRTEQAAATRGQRQTIPDRSTRSHTAAGAARQGSKGPGCSVGGFAFSCDAKAQSAEIAMILGERACPIKHTASFYEQRSSLRAQRLGRARNAAYAAESGPGVDDRAGRGDAVGGGGVHSSLEGGDTQAGGGGVEPASPISTPPSSTTRPPTQDMGDEEKGDESRA